MVLAIEVTDWDSSKNVAELNRYSKGILIYFSLELISTFKIILVTSWWTVETPECLEKSTDSVLLLYQFS